MICTTSKHAAEAKGCSDALFMDYRGYVAEATGANIFFVQDGEVHTPKPDCFLNGITRQTVIGMLKERQIKVHERHIMPGEMESFQQCWLTGTAAEVTPGGPDRRLQLRGRRDAGRGEGVRGPCAGLIGSVAEAKAET
jgi:branched-chain amino acid aminotransferase